MKCPHCSNSIKPGMEISLDPERGNPNDPVFCPYCLHHLLPEDRERPSADADADVSVTRFTMRRQVRERFVDRLLASSTDGQLRCPICDHRLNNNSRLMLRNSEHFTCPGCSRDLAYEAYRQEAYHELSWLSLAAALADGKADPKCTNCCYLGAAAVACQQALSWIPKNHPGPSKLLASMVRHSTKEMPADDTCYASCPVVRHYRKEVGQRLLLL